MELKLRSAPLRMAELRCFNRTFMELKPLWLMLIAKSTTSFNRTFMELKRKKNGKCWIIKM